MFKHQKNGKANYSIKEKINYYQKIIDGKLPKAPLAHKRKAKRRITALKKLDQRQFDEPTLIATDDKHFGNGLSKPRLAVVIDKDDIGRLLVGQIEARTSKNIILDKDPNRQVGNKKAWIDRSEVYETKIVSKNVKPLSKYDREKIKSILRKN